MKVPLAFLVHNSSLSGMSYSMTHRALYSLSWFTDIHNWETLESPTGITVIV